MGTPVEVENGTKCRPRAPPGWGMPGRIRAESAVAPHLLATKSFFTFRVSSPAIRRYAHEQVAFGPASGQPSPGHFASLDSPFAKGGEKSSSILRYDGSVFCTSISGFSSCFDTELIVFSGFGSSLRGKKPVRAVCIANTHHKLKHDGDFSCTVHETSR